MFCIKYTHILQSKKEGKVKKGGNKDNSSKISQFWLKKAILEADKITERSVSRHKTNTELPEIVCKRGCYACCLNPIIPILEIEFTAIQNFICESLDPDTLRRIMANVLGMENNPKCPFLVEKECAVYEYRPLACRHFLVTSQPCDKYEDVFKTRPHDLVPINKDECRIVAKFMFRAMGFSKQKSNMKAKRSELMEYTSPLHEFNFRNLIVKILKRVRAMED
ncbi:MAG: hypothetical protein GF349_00890 [Candidatus Magasanikbacteria bacterium]|nr:hypothetical protein [Candidatus Magasanikbacteria bacterium]